MMESKLRCVWRSGIEMRHRLPEVIAKEIDRTPKNELPILLFEISKYISSEYENYSTLKDRS
jgi:hypothetical protein